MRSEDLRSAEAETMTCVIVSHEMTALLGRGAVGAPALPADPRVLCFDFDAGDPPGLLRLEAVEEALSERDSWRILFLVDAAAVERLGGRSLLDAEGGVFHLTTEMRVIAQSLREPPVAEAACSTYRLGKSIELLCETLRQHDAGELIPAVGEGALSPADTRRVLAAKRIIDERWNEKLTLERIARACGLNRAKLTRGYRELFDCTVAEALADRRLGQASRLLLTTDLPVQLVGYEAGYLNNASFARAFSRRYGRSPSTYRATGMAA